MQTRAADGTYEVWISREEMVDFLLYEASLEASPATRSKMSGQRVSHAWVRRAEPWQPTVDKRVEDGHGTVRNTRVRVDLLEHCARASASEGDRGKAQRLTHPCRCSWRTSPCASCACSSWARPRRRPWSS